MFHLVNFHPLRFPRRLEELPEHLEASLVFTDAKRKRAGEMAQWVHASSTSSRTCVCIPRNHIILEAEHVCKPIPLMVRLEAEAGESLEVCGLAWHMLSMWASLACAERVG